MKLVRSMIAVVLAASALSGAVAEAAEAGGPVQELGISIVTRANPQLERFRFHASFRDRGVFPQRWRGL